MTSAQELLHWLEVGRGARLIRLAALLAGAVALSLLLVWKQFRGPRSEATLLQADMARQVAAGAGFTTLVNSPQTAAWRQARGQGFHPDQPYPELNHAPLYPLVLAAGLRLVPARTREEWFTVPSQPSAGFAADYYLLAVNVALLWVAAGSAYLLGRRLFDARVGWVTGIAVLASVPLWDHTLAVDGTPLLLVLGLFAFLVWYSLELRLASAQYEPDEARASTPESSASSAPSLPRASQDRLGVWWLALGALGGALFLADYTAGVLTLVMLAYSLVRLRGRSRVRRASLALRPWAGAGLLALGFLLVAGPWIIRNLELTGSPVGLAIQEVALKAGDPTAEPAMVRATLSATLPDLQLRKLGNKVLTSLQATLQTSLWSGGAMWFVAFFAAGLLYSFRNAATNRMRWWFALSLAVAVLAQSALDAGDTERPAVVWLAPLLIVFGAGFFFVLLGSHPRLGAWPRALAAVLLLLQAVPLLHEGLAPPPGVRFQYPPYFPALLRGVRSELESRQVLGRFGAMADIPAGVAWYGGVRCWAQPPTLRDFYAITLQQPIGELLLTPRTLDRPFFSELNARAVAPGTLAAVSNRFGEWGEIYAGLVTGTMPREFPLKAPHQVAENLFVLLNPALPPPRGK